MASKRNISTKKPMFGNARSFSMRATRRKFNPNYQNKRIFVPELDQFVQVRLTVGELRTVDKIGLLEFLARQQIPLKRFLTEQSKAE